MGELLPPKPRLGQNVVTFQHDWKKRRKTRLTVTRPLEAIKEKSHKFEYEKVKLLYDKKSNQ